MGDDEETTDRLPVERAIKFVGKDEIAGLAMPWGLDTDGEQFTPNTDFHFDWFGKSGRPFLFEHGLDKALKAEVIGRQSDYEIRPEEGVWAAVQLDRHAKYRKAVDQLIEEGALGYSSGAMQHLAHKNRRGEITDWPWVELSGTPIPSHPKTLDVHYVKSADFMARLEADVPIPDPLKAALTALDEWAALRTDDDEALPDGAKFADLVDRLSVDGPAWVKARRDWYAKSGRVLSAAALERHAAHPEALRQLADDIDELLAPKAGKSDLTTLLLDTERVLARASGVVLPSEGATSP